MKANRLIWVNKENADIDKISINGRFLLIMYACMFQIILKFVKSEGIKHS